MNPVFALTLFAKSGASRGADLRGRNVRPIRGGDVGSGQAFAKNERMRLGAFSSRGLTAGLSHISGQVCVARELKQCNPASATRYSGLRWSKP